ncbi:MAG: hypothetical protein P8M25_00965 [Paracoccaceae bacterium]|jgi:hypothetical protein|nr:hypothetical protein [Marinovum sp.]MDG2403560.1 hypothetical protein [Paracoccaceae bacterium]
MDQTSRCTANTPRTVVRGVTAADPEGSRAMGLVGGLTAAGIGNLAH